MNVINLLDVLNELDTHIIDEKTGPADKLAEKLEISRNRLYKLINDLQEEGAPIRYSRQRETFYYLWPYSIKVQLQVFYLMRETSEARSHMRVIPGGKFKLD